MSVTRTPFHVWADLGALCALGSTQSEPDVPGHLTWLPDDLCPREADDGPAGQDEAVLPGSVGVERLPGAVRVVAVDLDGESHIRVGEVHPRRRARDRVLEHSGREVVVA